jgi:5,5'-dehydrodivanillate O-demethylase oxygenase subunit
MMTATLGFISEHSASRPPAGYTDFARTGPGTLAGRFMRSFWQPVSRARDLAPGRAKPLRVMSEDFTLYRGESGAPHLVAFRCAHRGTQLSTGWVEGDELRCFYHGWKYGPDGQCVEQPAEPEPFCQRIRIKSYPVQEYLGLIFAYLGEGEPPPLPCYHEFEEPGIVENGPPNVWPCNFFNRLENSPDPVHLAFVHRWSPFSESGLVGIPEVSGQETDYGIEVRARRPGDKERITHFHMPNINLISNSGDADEPNATGNGLSINLSWRVPVDDESCMSFNATHIPLTGEAAEQYLARRAQRQPAGRPAAELAEAVLRGELRIEDTTDAANVVNVQDYVAQIGQGAIAPREQDHLGRSDVLVILLRRIWERELRNLAEGRPLKQWQRPERLAMTYGA